MSYAMKPEPQHLQLDPKIAINVPQYYCIKKGSQTHTFQPYTTNNYSNSSIIFNVTVNSPSTLINRNVKYLIPFLVDITAPAQARNLSTDFDQGLAAIRAFPIANVITTQQCQLNNQSITNNPNQFIQSVQRYRIFNKETQVTMSDSPSLCDTFLQYSDGVGSSMSPLQTYFNSQYYQVGRGAYSSLFKVTTNSTSEYKFTVNLCEDVFLPPFVYDGHDDVPALVGLNLLTFQLTLGNLQRILSVDTTNSLQSAWTALSVTIGSNPTLLMSWDSLPMNVPIPREVVYPISNIIQYQSVGASIGAGENYSIMSNNVTLSSIPERLYIAVSFQDSTYQSASLSTPGYGLTDTFFSIGDSQNPLGQGLTILFNNITGHLSSATQFDLHKISVENGLMLSYPQFANYVGSPLCIDFTKDIGLPGNLAVGVGGQQYQLQCSVSGINNYSSTVTPVLRLTLCQPGLLTIDHSGQATLQTNGIFSEQDILNEYNLPYKPMTFNKRDIYGGDWRDNLKKGWDFFKSDVVPVVKELAPVVGPLIKMAAAGAPMGGSLVGGKHISRSELGRRLRY